MFASTVSSTSSCAAVRAASAAARTCSAVWPRNGRLPAAQMRKARRPVSTRTPNSFSVATSRHATQASRSKFWSSCGSTMAPSALAAWSSKSPPLMTSLMASAAARHCSSLPLSWTATRPSLFASPFLDLGTSIWQPVAWMSLLMVLPPRPITRPRLSSGTSTVCGASGILPGGGGGAALGSGREGGGEGGGRRPAPLPGGRGP
mmetsp:Transcript_68582/g.212607  ORF Transcript_68582/g.212607 Transcript_68582/m.212607 type:complete len:204 (-) Transcript_68582:2-613(-)